MKLLDATSIEAEARWRAIRLFLMIPDFRRLSSTARWFRMGRIFEGDMAWLLTGFKLVAWWTFVSCSLLLAFSLLAAMRSTFTFIPLGIQVACAALILLAAVLVALMMRERGRALRACDRFLAVFEDIKPATPEERAEGLSAQRIAEIRRKAAVLRGRPGEWWRMVDESLECYTNPDGRQGWFVTRPITNALPEDDVIAPFYHASFHQAVPSILTALGLLVTFIAILLSLAGVTYNPNDAARPVSGIDELINGLAGKFLSSIVALILSVVFTFLEKKVCERQILSLYSHLLNRCRDVFPFLSQSRILLDIQRILVRQGEISGEAAGSREFLNS